jgi:hypothetical protein
LLPAPLSDHAPATDERGRRKFAGGRLFKWTATPLEKLQKRQEKRANRIPLQKQTISGLIVTR